MSGWIKLHRELIDWEWYTDHNTCRLFIHCILRANFEDKVWRGIPIKRGSFYTSLDTLASETGLSNRQIRTALDKLSMTGEVTSSGMARGRMITVANYSDYQQDDRLSVNEKAGKGQAIDRVATTNKNLKNEKKIIIPDGINQQAWNEWIDYRKSKKKTVSQKAANKQFKLLTNYDFDVQQHIIDHSIQNDYQGLFAPKGNTNDQQNKSGRPSAANRQTPAQRTRAAAERWEAEQENNVSTMGSDAGGLRPSIQQPIRGGTNRDLGEVINGDYSRSDT
jgi:hypothetical protein